MSHIFEHEFLYDGMLYSQISMSIWIAYVCGFWWYDCYFKRM